MPISEHIAYIAPIPLRTAECPTSASNEPPADLILSLQKWCTQSEGIWEKIRQVFSIAPNRSNGISLNTSYRNPPPGANDPLAYDDRVTLPAGDIAENPYWKRDNRRKYPRQSYVNQADVVGLLTVGSKATPKEEVLQIGEAGEKQLAEVKTQGEQQGLSVFFEKNKEVGKSIFGTNGLPPMPANLNPASRYTFDHEHGYDEEKSVFQRFPFSIELHHFTDFAATDTPAELLFKHHTFVYMFSKFGIVMSQFSAKEKKEKTYQRSRVVDVSSLTVYTIRFTYIIINHSSFFSVSLLLSETAMHRHLTFGALDMTARNLPAALHIANCLCLTTVLYQAVMAFGACSLLFSLPASLFAADCILQHRARLRIYLVH